MPYPRLLNLSANAKERLLSYCKEITERHDMERGAWIQELQDEQKAYYARPSQEVRTFPFRGASNLIIPLAAIAVEAIHAREITQLFALKPFINCSTKSILPLPSGAPIEDVETPLEDYMHYELIHNCAGKRVLGDLFLEKTKYGTCVAKVGYEKLVRKSVRKGPDGTEENFAVVVKDGATLDRTPLPNFIMPFQSQDEQTSQWCGEIHSRSPYNVKLLCESEFFYKETWEYLKKAYTPMGATLSPNQQMREDIEKLENRQPVWPENIEWRELEMGFDIDDDGKDEEIKVHYHHDCNYLMAVRYNDYDDLHRQWRHATYFPVEGRWPGIGVVKMAIEFQREVTIQHRQRLDNATLANIRMIVIHKLSGYGPGEPVYPGKMWFVDDMEHVETLQMGDVYDSSFANEQSSLLYGQQRMGVNELTLGIPQTGTPGTATGDIARIQEASKKFEFVFENSRDFVSVLAVDLLVNIAQYGSKQKKYYDTVEGGALVREFLTLPVDLIRDGLLIEIGTTSASNNRAIDRQNGQQITGILQAYYTGALELAQMSGDMALQALIVNKALYGINEVTKQLLETFELRNLDRILFKKELEKLYGGTSGAGAIPGQGGNPNTQGNGETPGVPTAQEIIGLLARIAPGQSGSGNNAGGVAR